MIKEKKELNPLIIQNKYKQIDTSIHPFYLTLNITNECNLRCKYCYIKKQPEYMSFDIAKKSIDFIYKNLSALRQKHNEILNDYKGFIYFFGGEPLLNYTLIQEIVDYVENTYPNSFNFAIVTNGLLLTNNICQFLKDHDFQVKISYDGFLSTERVDKYKQNVNNLIIERIKLLLQYIPEAIVRGTITKDNLPHWFDTYLEYEELGFQSCSFDFEYYTDWTNSYNIIKDELEKFKKYYEYNFLSNEYPKLEFPLINDTLNELIRKDLTDILDLKDYNKNPLGICNHCGFGLEMISVDINGNIYPCHEYPGYETTHCIGNINTGIDYNLIKQYQKELCNIEDNFIKTRTCENKDCLILKYNIDCNYLSCPAQVLRTQQIDLLNCIVKNHCIKLVLEMTKELFMSQNETFDNYLNEFSYYIILKDIVSQSDKEVRQQFIEYYKPGIELTLIH